MRLAPGNKKVQRLGRRFIEKSSQVNEEDFVDNQIKLIIESQPNWKGQLLADLRTAILDSSSEITEHVKWKMPSKPLGSATWEVNGILCVSDFLKNAVRLTFPKGAAINDPEGLFNARLDSKTTRAIDFTEGQQLSTESLRALITETIALNKSK